MTSLEKRLKKMTNIIIITKYREMFIEIQKRGKKAYAAEISRTIRLPESVISKVLKHCETMKIPLIKKRGELKGTRGKRKTLELTDICKAGLRKLERSLPEETKDHISLVENHLKSESGDGTKKEKLIETFEQMNMGVNQETNENKEKEPIPKITLERTKILQLQREWEEQKKSTMENRVRPKFN